MTVKELLEVLSERDDIDLDAEVYIGYPTSAVILGEGDISIEEDGIYIAC